MNGIHKIIEIKNLGKFKSPTFGKPNWNGVFDQTNVIYGPNGSGKTTLSLLFRSLLGNDTLIHRKKTFGSTESTEIRLLDDNSRELKFQKGKWNRHLEMIEVFDSFYIEDNVYIITLKKRKSNSDNIFEILLGEENVKIKREIETLKMTFSTLKRKRESIRKRRSSTEDLELRQKLQTSMDELRHERETTLMQISELENKLITLSGGLRDSYLEKINSYLKYFNPNLKLSKLSQFGQKVVYTLQVAGTSLKTDESEYSLKYSLSEGDKNALSLSFFLGRIEMLPNLQDHIIVVDDPITSFDYGRRNTTINLLVRLSRRVHKFVLLTHDLSFANDFSRKLDFKCNTIKIEFDGNSSCFMQHDVDRESLTGIFKDLTVLHDFMAKGATSDIERREVARCIRPILEGVFRIKFFKEIQKNEWLGNVIDKIRLSDASSIYAPFKIHLPELTDINDYSKEYHHSNPYYLETPINDQELRVYVRRTLDLARTL